MSLQNNFSWDDAPMSFNYGVSIKHHSMLYSGLKKENPLSAISTYELDEKQKNTEQVLEEANSYNI